MNIEICDAVMGSGKTSAAINYMNSSGGRFIFITPYLKECERIMDGCPIKSFKTPNEKPLSKLNSLHFLLGRGYNIASTHALFASYTEETIQKIQNGHYTLILDEVFSVVYESPVSAGDVAELINNGYIDVDPETYRVRWLRDDYGGTTFRDMMLRAKAGTLLYYNNTFLFWMFPPEVFRAFDKVIVLTYLFSAQVQKYYFDIHGFDYKTIGVTKDEHGEYQFTEKENGTGRIPGLRDKVHILDDEKLNHVGFDRFAFSSSWAKRMQKDPKETGIIRSNISNVLRHYFHGTYKDCMWTCFKEQKDYLLPNGYARSFVPCICRATNNYRDRKNLAYCVNIFFNPFLKMYFQERGCYVDEDRYALSEMIQWIWRSAIREGQEINIYIPSYRMRKLLQDWLDGVS